MMKSVISLLAAASLLAVVCAAAHPGNLRKTPISHYGDDCPTLQDYPNCNIDCHFSWNVVPPVGSFLYKCLGVPTNASTVHFSLSKDPADSAGADLKISLNGETMYNYNLEPNDPQDINVTTHDPSPSSGDWNFYVANRDWLVWKHCNVHLVVQMT